MQTSLFESETKKPAKKPAKKRAIKTAAKASPPAKPKAELLRDEIIPATAEQPTGYEKVLGVGDYLDYINQILKVTTDVKVQGEISRLSPHPTGVYMTLKDKEGDGVLDCYINPYTFRGLGMQLEEGMEIKISGTPTIFKRRSQLSFKVENIELTGEGTLKKAYELLRLKLEQEGLFDRKRELPEFITNIGIITSKTGAVIDDFRQNLEKLGLKLHFIDCRVEGAQSVNQITAAVRHFNIKHPELDCLVIMRGGGSLEDLQAFNNEDVVKEIFASRIPVIAAIGHDRDVPLVCLTADKFTSTPTAAAVLINSSWARLKTGLPELEAGINQRFQGYLDNEYNRLSNLTHRLTGRFNGIFQRFRYLSEKILSASMAAISRQLQAHKDQIAAVEKLLAAASPERNLKLGYSLAYDSAGKIIRSAKKVAKGQKIRVQLHEGALQTEIINTEPNG